jgi:hypothetical protein
MDSVTAAGEGGPAAPEHAGSGGAIRAEPRTTPGDTGKPEEGG